MQIRRAALCCCCLGAVVAAAVFFIAPAVQQLSGGATIAVPSSEQKPTAATTPSPSPSPPARPSFDVAKLARALDLGAWPCACMMCASTLPCTPMQAQPTASCCTSRGHGRHAAPADLPHGGLEEPMLEGTRQRRGSLPALRGEPMNPCGLHNHTCVPPAQCHVLQRTVSWFLHQASPWPL